jgi:hypothetical protein
MAVINWPDTTGDSPASLSDLEVLFQRVISIALGLGGIVLFVMLVVGGFKYLTSGGDPKAVESAQKTLTSAILGLVLLLSAYLILKLIGNFTGIDLTTFRVSINSGN